MPVYLVRLRDEDQPVPTPRRHADITETHCPESEAATTYFIGTFHERNLTNLFWAVDEQLDPHRCEYVVLKPGHALFLTEDNGDAPHFHYNERLSVEEMNGWLNWQRIPKPRLR